MAIVQISKIQHRTGNLIDLPQLSDAELGWASDANRLFIGTTPPQNIEVLTSYSSISFSQIDGSSNANLNLSNVMNGQVLAYDTTTTSWTNKGGNASDPGNASYYTNTNIHLGNVSNVKLGGGVNGYVLQTDGSGNLNWTEQIAGTPGNGLPGGGNTQIQYNDGGFFGGTSGFTFDKVSGAVVLPGTLSVSNTITGTRLISNIATGTAPLTVTSTTQVANLNSATAGTVITAAQPNITSVGTLTSLGISGTVTASTVVSNVATGTAPFTVTSTTQVANLNVATSGLANLATFATTANAVAGANVSGTVANATYAVTAGTANAVAGANVSGAVSFATTANSVAGANVSGQVTYAATANSVAAANVSGLGNLALVNKDGNASNILYGNGIFASAPTPGVSYGNSNVATFLASYGSNTITTTGNITAGNLSLGTGSATLGTLTTGSNTTVGTITGNFSLSAGSRLNATYADLAEYYEADQLYESGTILAFGGEKEVTLAEDGTNKVAGVVTTNPAYVMNQCCKGYAVAIALQGRVPTKVRGTIRKGDMMVSAGNGYARPSASPQMGTVIGKALENFDGIEGVIEVAVGRL